MHGMMRGTIIGFGSGEISGRQASTPGMVLLSGIRMRMMDGEVVWMRNCIIGPEAMLILESSVTTGETTELWLSGSTSNPYVYGIKTAADRSYANAVASARRGPAHYYLFLGLLTLILGVGLILIIVAIGAYINASDYEVPYTRAQFNAGWEKLHPSHDPGVVAGGLAIAA